MKTSTSSSVPQSYPTALFPDGQTLPLPHSQWEALGHSFFPTIERIVRESQAIQHVQRIQSGLQLLRLLLLYVGHGWSLRTLNLWAAAQEQLDITDEGLRNQFLHSEDFVRALLVEVFARAQAPADRTTARIRMVDATRLAGPGGAQGTQHRLHVTFDLGSIRMVGVELTDEHQAESLHRCEAQAFDMVMGDRAYELAKHMHYAQPQKWFPIVRTQLLNVRLQHEDGTPYCAQHLLGLAEQGQCDVNVFIPLHERPPMQARLLMIARPPEAAARARQAVYKRSRKKGHTRHGLGVAMRRVCHAADHFTCRCILRRQARSVVLLSLASGTFFQALQEFARLSFVQEEESPDAPGSPARHCIARRFAPTAPIPRSARACTHAIEGGESMASDALSVRVLVGSTHRSLDLCLDSLWR